MKRVKIESEVYDLLTENGSKMGGSRRDWAYNALIHYFMVFKANESQFNGVKIRNYIPRNSEKRLIAVPEDIWEQLYEMASWNGRTIKGQLEYIILAVDKKQKNEKNIK